MSDYPPKVLIREVGPRDGFQNEPEVIATDDKVAIIDKLTATGLKRIEITSFVRPDVIPQLADGAEVLGVLGEPPRQRSFIQPHLPGRAAAQGEHPRSGQR